MHKQTVTVNFKKVNMWIELTHAISLLPAAHIFLINQISLYIIHSERLLPLGQHVSKLCPTHQNALSDVTGQKPLYLVTVPRGLVAGNSSNIFPFLSSRQLKPQGRKDCLTWLRLCRLSLQICQFPLCFSSGPFHFPLGQRKRKLKGLGFCQTLFMLFDVFNRTCIIGFNTKINSYLQSGRE